jgi:hypothetical protein
MRVLYLRFTRRCVARTSPVLAFVAGARAKASGSAGADISCRNKPPPSDALAQLCLAPTYFGERRHRVETAIGLAQPPLDGIRQLGMGQRTVIGRRHDSA